LAHILIADDHDAIREVYANVLEGHALDFVETAGDAAGAMVRGIYDLVIMDIALKRSSGVTAALALRGIGYTGPIIAVTGGVVETDPLLVERAGFAETLIKPVPPDEIRRIVVQYADG
jgi:two-component system OmpR family response regulator